MLSGENLFPHMKKPKIEARKKKCPHWHGIASFIVCMREYHAQRQAAAPEG